MRPERSRARRHCMDVIASTDREASQHVGAWTHHPKRGVAMNHRVLTIAAITGSACLNAHAAVSRLLVSEVVVAPTQAEMVAIYNPNPYVVDLSNYYLAD